MIACCISGYVYVYRFKIDLAGATCAFEKIYWDMKEGQLREEYPKWDGLNSIGSKLEILIKFIEDLNELNENGNILYPLGDDWRDDDTYKLSGNDDYINAIKELRNYVSDNEIITYTINGKNYSFTKDGDNEVKITFLSDYININNIAAPNTLFGQILLEIREKINPYITKLKSAQDKINDLIINSDSYCDSLKTVSSDLKSINSDWEKFRPYILDEWDYYRKLTKAFYYIILLIYFILVLILAIAGITFLTGYVCSKEQKFIKSILVIIWNAVRFFSFSFFMYGGTFGMLSYAFKDGIGFMNYAFSAENLNSPNPMIIPNGTSIPMLQYCLLGNKTNFIYNFKLDTLLIESLENIYSDLNKLIAYDTSSLKINLFTINEVSKKIKDTTNINKLVNQTTKNAIIDDVLENIQLDLDKCAGTDEWVLSITNCSGKTKVNIDSMKKKLSSSQGNINSLCDNGSTCCISIDKIYDLIDYNNYKKIYNNCTKDHEYVHDNILFAVNLYKKYNSIVTYIDNMQNKISSCVNKMSSEIYDKIEEISRKFKDSLESFSEDAITYGGIFSFMDCSFLKNDLNIIFEVFTSLSNRSRSLCGITCSLACFGCVTVYFSLFCIYHSDKEKFKDLKHEKFGGIFSNDEYRKKNSKKNPLIDNQYKKNKDKEIELTSRISIEDNENTKIDSSRSKNK